MTATTGKSIRLGRLLPGEGGRGACFAFDHGLQVGPIAGTEDLRAGVQLAIDAAFDAVILSPGAISRCADLLARKSAPAAIMRVDQTSMWRIGSRSGYAEGYTRQIATVEEAAQMGADGVISYFFTAHTDPELENRSMEIAAATASAARELGLVYVAEPLAARGGLMPTPFDGDVVAMNTRMAISVLNSSSDRFREASPLTGEPNLVTSCDATNVGAAALAAAATAKSGLRGSISDASMSSCVYLSWM